MSATVIQGSAKAHPKDKGDSENLPFGKTTDTYAKERALEQLEKRKQEAENKKADKFADSPIISNKPDKFANGPIVSRGGGKKRGASAIFKNSPIVSVQTSYSSNFALYIVIGWYLTGQITLWIMSLGLLGTGALAAGILSPVLIILESLGFNSSIIFSSFMGGGFAVSFLNSLLCLAIMGGVMMIYYIAGVKMLNSSTKYALFILAFVGYFLPFFQFAPWGVLWINYLRVNPE